MIKNLSISNFAIIDVLEVSFNEGMTSITGETGTGKSILLGALSLITGKRADLTLLKDPSKSSYRFKLARIYGQLNNLEMMYENYMEVVINNQAYLKNAPKEIVQNDKKLLKELTIEDEKLRSIVSSIN